MVLPPVNYRIMAKHTVEITGLREYMNEHSVTYASSYGKGSCKELRCTLRGSYEVWNNSERVLETMQPIVAIDKYNELP